MRILLVGAGAVGSIVGGALVRSGYDVTFADEWQDNINALNKDGLKITGVNGEKKISVKAIHFNEINTLKNKPQLVFISVKNYDTEKILGLISPLIKRGTVIISTQNGINEETIALKFGSEHVLGAVTELSGYMAGPGVVVETRKEGGFVIGELDGSDTERVHGIASIMSGCGKIKISHNIMGLLWSKLIWNSMLNPLTAISGFGTGKILQVDQYRRLAIEIGKEGYVVSNKHKIQLEPLTLMGIDPRRLNPSRPTEMQAEEAALKLLPEPLDKMPSMAQDIMKSRKTEIDYINGIVFQYGKKLGIPTPINEEVIQVLHSVEDKKLNQSPKLLDKILKKFNLEC